MEPDPVEKQILAAITHYDNLPLHLRGEDTARYLLSMILLADKLKKQNETIRLNYTGPSA
jgi:hypothetical protein